MSSHQSTLSDPSVGRREPSGAEARSYDEYDEPHGFGWVVFSGVIFMIAGVLNFIYGIAAIGKSSFYVANSHFVISDLKTWGWIVMLIGVLQVVVAAGVWGQAQWARWTGVAIAGLNSIAQLMFISANPWLAVTVFTLDILVIYGLVCYGGRLEQR